MPYKNPLLPGKAKPLFTDMDLKIIRMLYRQKSNREMADELGKSIRTIEFYRHELLTKTNSKNAVGIVLYALKNGICKLP